MQFFLYEIVARIGAICLCVVLWRQLRRSLVERKTRYSTGGDWLNWLIDWSNLVAYRDTQPVMYWIQIGFQIFGLVACFFVAIFGWWHPNS